MTGDASFNRYNVRREVDPSNGSKWVVEDRGAGTCNVTIARHADETAAASHAENLNRMERINKRVRTCRKS